MQKESKPSAVVRLFVLRTLSVFVGCLGIYLTYGGIHDLVRMFRAELSIGDVIAELFFIVLLLAFASCCFVLCLRTWRSETPELVRSIAAIVSVFTWLHLAMLLDSLAPQLPGMSEHASNSVFTFAAIAIAAVVYVGVSWWLIPANSLTSPHRRIPSLLSGFVCCFVWLVTFDLLMEVAPKKPDFDSILKFPWGLVALIVPFVVAKVMHAWLQSVGGVQTDATSGEEAL